MITIGIDAHKHLHVATALDAAGRELDRWQGPNSPDGWAALLAWGRSLRRRAPRRWGIKGAGHYGRGLAQALLAAGEQVYDINPRWTALARRSSRTRGKSDRLLTTRPRWPATSGRKELIWCLLRRRMRRRCSIYWPASAMRR